MTFLALRKATSCRFSTALVSTVIIFNLISNPSYASEPPAYDDREFVCPARTNIELGQCLDRHKAIALRKLDQVYKWALAERPLVGDRDPRANRSVLVASQKAWRSYLVANCTFEAGASAGGTVDIYDYETQCEIEGIKSRSKYLRDTAQGN